VHRQRSGTASEGAVLRDGAVAEDSAFSPSYLVVAILLGLLFALAAWHLLGSGFRH